MMANGLVGWPKPNREREGMAKERVTKETRLGVWETDGLDQLCPIASHNHPINIIVDIVCGCRSVAQRSSKKKKATN